MKSWNIIIMVFKSRMAREKLFWYNNRMVLQKQLALERFLERGMKDARRIHYHGDKGVRMLQAGVTPQAGPYDEPHMDLPTYRVDTTQGYHPSLEELREQIFGDETV